MKSVGFVYGWSEGSWQSKKFRKYLERHGYTISNPKDADIIIAHSSGCYLVPEKNAAKQVILIGLPYWPGKSLFTSVLQNIKVGVSNHSRGTDIFWWINKMSHNLWYIVARPKASYDVLSKHRVENLPQNNVTLVRNTDDTFCHKDINKILPQCQKYNFVEIPGDHEDCWLHPEKYVPLIVKAL